MNKKEVAREIARFYWYNKDKPEVRQTLMSVASRLELVFLVQAAYEDFEENGWKPF